MADFCSNCGQIVPAGHTLCAPCGAGRGTNADAPVARRAHEATPPRRVLGLRSWTWALIGWTAVMAVPFIAVAAEGSVLLALSFVGGVWLVGFLVLGLIWFLTKEDVLAERF